MYEYIQKRGVRVKVESIRVKSIKAKSIGTESIWVESTWIKSKCISGYWIHIWKRLAVNASLLSTINVYTILWYGDWSSMAIINRFSIIIERALVNSTKDITNVIKIITYKKYNKKICKSWVMTHVIFAQWNWIYVALYAIWQIVELPWTKICFVSFAELNDFVRHIHKFQNRCFRCDKLLAILWKELNYIFNLIQVIICYAIYQRCLFEVMV